MAGKAFWIPCISFCVALIITGIVLFSISFRGLEATEFGLKYSSYSKSIDETKIYDEGTYFLGPSMRFIKFPIEVKALNYNKEFYIRTKDGMRLEIVVSIQYKLNKRLDVTLKLLRNWGENNYEGVIEKIAKDSIRNSASNFAVDSYVYTRKDVDNQMKNDLTKELDELGVSLENFQLTEVIFPDQFKSIILDTQQQEIEVQNAKNDKEKQIQEANGRLAKAPSDAANLLQSKTADIISRMSVYKKMKEVYAAGSQVPQYRQQLKNKMAAVTGYIDNKVGLWVIEFMDIINERSSWEIRETVPTPGVFKSMLNSPA